MSQPLTTLMRSLAEKIQSAPTDDAREHIAAQLGIVVHANLSRLCGAVSGETQAAIVADLRQVLGVQKLITDTYAAALLEIRACTGDDAALKIIRRTFDAVAGMSMSRSALSPNKQTA